MPISLLDLATICAYVALGSDLLMQIHRVWARKHSADISVLGEFVRIVAVAIILFKLTAVGDTYLIVGQVAMLVLITIYFFLVVRFRKNV